MSEGPDNLVLQILRRVDQNVDRLRDDMRDLKIPVSGIEENMVVVQRRLDRFDDRLERIERRFDLIDGPPGVRE